MSFINTNLNIFGICCPLGYNISNSLDVFFIAHSIALAYLCFYHTYALPQMWPFIEACLATLGPFMSGSQGIWICLLVRLKSGPSPQRLLINFVLTILNRPYMVIFNPHYYSNYFIYLLQVIFDIFSKSNYSNDVLLMFVPSRILIHIF
jgi:hypothetical protein